MSDTALAAMRAAGEALLTALDGRDVHTIERATEAYRLAVEDVRGCGAWHATPALGDAARDLPGHVDRLTIRVGNLTRVSAERLAALEAAGAVASPRGYQPRR